MLRVPSFQKWLPLVLIAGCAHAQPVQKPLAGAPHFTIHDAIQAEWMRAAPNLKLDALPQADRERYKLTLQRIGAPGMPKLLPQELENPTAEIWTAKAMVAKTPQERFTALHFLNRLKSPKALTALDGLKPEDAGTWPRHLHLEANLATARLQGGEVSKELQSFMDALKARGKVEPIRAQAARLRLVMAGKEKELLPSVPFGTASTLALLDALRQSSEAKRSAILPDLFEFVRKPFDTPSEKPFHAIGIEPPKKLIAKSPISLSWWEGLYQRISEELPPPLPTQFLASAKSTIQFPIVAHPILRIAMASALARAQGDDAKATAIDLGGQQLEPLVRAALLPSLRVLAPASADKLRESLVVGTNPIARSAAIEDLPEAPSDLDALTQLTWKDRDLEPQQTLIESYSRWKLPKEQQIALLKPWLQHPDWACRFLAYQQLVKLDATTAWPTAPEPSDREKKLLAEAERLASKGKPVRLRISFSGNRQVTLRLDPTIAPINVANIAMLARKGFFNGRLVPRVVPDFVVQMGSPYDTMDGGPGYSVRCEDSLVWYGPGSVGMALSGKDTGGSQLFITTNATPHLTGKYTRMGEVEDPDRALKLLDDLELGAKIERMDVFK